MPLAILYLDESGVTNAVPSQTSHYVLGGIALPARNWIPKHDELAALRRTYGLGDNEFHVAWMVRPYPEQLAVPSFPTLTRKERRVRVTALRAAKAAALEATGDTQKTKELRTLHRKTDPYIHLTLAERRDLVTAVARAVSGWKDAVLFGEAIDKRVARFQPLEENALEQVASRFEAWLQQEGRPGVVAYDLNESVVHRLTAHVATLQQKGGQWRSFAQLVGHPFFVDSRTSAIVQAADVLAYALRRYCENGERPLFDHFFPRFHRRGGRLVGLRHYHGRQACACVICAEPR